MASDESEDIASRQAPITSTPGVIEPELIAVPSLAASIAWHEQRLARLQVEDAWTAHDELETREASVACSSRSAGRSSSASSA